jgi:hypothetical protein
MNVWLVNLFDRMSTGEGHVGRVVSIAQSLVGAGAEVTWWSSDWDHGSKQRRPLSDFECHPWLGVAVPSPAYASNVGPQRLISHAVFARRLKRMALKAVREGRLEAPDVIVVNLPPPSVAAAVADLKREFGCQVVVDVRDAWPEKLAQDCKESFSARCTRSAASVGMNPA